VFFSDGNEKSMAQSKKYKVKFSAYDSFIPGEFSVFFIA